MPRNTPLSSSCPYRPPCPAVPANHVLWSKGSQSRTPGDIRHSQYHSQHFLNPRAPTYALAHPPPPWTPCLFVGGGFRRADTQFVAGVIEAKLEAYRTEFGRYPTVRAAATATRNLCYANKDQLSAGIICAGWDSREGGSVFSVPQGGSLLEQPFAVSGSGAVYALGYCDDNLRPDLGRDECVSHVRTAVEMAVRRDGASGGVIRLCVVSADGVERWTVVPGTAAAAAGIGEEEEGRREARRASDGGG
ncbi:unnamed protein product [Ectocarpus sp. 4 AP-2014]